MLSNDHLYDKYKVEIEVRERLDGGVPKDPELIQAWVKAGTGHDDDKTKEQVAAHLPDLEAAADEASKGMWCGFKEYDDDGTTRRYVEDRQLKAMLRECATVLGITKKKRGSRQVIQHGFEVKGNDKHRSRIFIEAKNEGMHEGAIHVVTAQGPRSAIKRNDYVGEGSWLRFEVWILKTAPAETRHIGEKDLGEMLTLAQENGLGANRSQGAGKFSVETFEKIPEEKKTKKK